MREDAVGKIAVLDEPVRRRIYLFVRDADRAVTREEVAEALGVSRKLAAFHLDKLLAAGLLETHYARPPGRSGPGAGRSAKYYRRAPVEIDVSLPERRYDLAGELLLDALTAEEPGERGADAALRVAHERGAAYGDAARRAAKLRSPGPERALAAAREELERHGFEPYAPEPRSLALRNCPFHALARRDPELMCAINHAFVGGLLQGLGARGVEALLTCAPGDCCVTLRATQRR